MTKNATKLARDIEKARKALILLEVRQYLYTNTETFRLTCDCCDSGKPFALCNCPEVREFLGVAIRDNSYQLSQAVIAPLDLVADIGTELIISAIGIPA